MGGDTTYHAMVEAGRTFRFLHITFSENQDPAIKRDDDGMVFEI